MPSEMQNGIGGFPKGVALLRQPALNKGTAFTEEERDALGIRWLLPPRIHSMDEQLRRVIGNLKKKQTDLDKYIFLTRLQDRNKTLFYRLLLDNLEELTPIVSRGPRAMLVRGFQRDGSEEPYRSDQP